MLNTYRYICICIHTYMLFIFEGLLTAFLFWFVTPELSGPMQSVIKVKKFYTSCHTKWTYAEWFHISPCDAYCLFCATSVLSFEFTNAVKKYTSLKSAQNVHEKQNEDVLACAWNGVLALILVSKFSASVALERRKGCRVFTFLPVLLNGIYLSQCDAAFWAWNQHVESVQPGGWHWVQQWRSPPLPFVHSGCSIAYCLVHRGYVRVEKGVVVCEQ